MDRGRRSSVLGGPGSIPKNELNKPAGRGQDMEPSNAGPYGQLLELPKHGEMKFTGNMVEPRKPDFGLGFDPDLLVGPLYVPAKTQSERIKEQLGDITKNLAKTLYTFDEFEDDEEPEDPVVELMKRQMNNTRDTEIRSTLATVMGEYTNMSGQVSAAHKERDEMLLQLADWFTTDHVDLDDIKMSFDESEQDSIKNSYFDTVTNFEKLKSLQNKIMRNTQDGKSTKSLQAVKHELEKDVIEKFKNMKDMSMQTMKLNGSETAPWMHAAQEIVNMLQSVRGENTEQMGAIQKKMQGMLDSLERQAIAIKSLTVELREQKEIVLKLTAENSDLSQDVTILRARYNKYEKDLRAAQQMIRQLHAQVEEKNGEIPKGQGKSLSESMSKMLAQFEPQPPLKTITSDPSFLRTRLKECEETLETLREEFSRSSEEKAEMRQELEEKREYMNSIEEENEKLSRDIRRLRQEIRQSVAVPVAAQVPVMPTTNEHTCVHCKCHAKDNEWEEEIANWKKDAGKWQAKCEYFKKCLADTEMKLSDAFREISDLRMERELPTPPPPKVEQVKPAAMPSAKSSAKPSAKSTADNVDKERPLSAPKPKEPQAPKKPRKEVRARYMQKPNKVEKLPDFQTPAPVIPDEIKQDLTPGMSRELQLFQAGDMQGKLNMLSSEIMEFVSEIGQMLYEEKDDDKGSKIQSMKAFAFDKQPPTGNAHRPSESRDNKDEEQKKKRTQALFSGQHAVAKLREAYELLSGSLNLQHNEYEAMYRSFKINNQRHMIRKAVMVGRMPISALQEFDKQQRKKIQDTYGPDHFLTSYFNISYGGQGGNRQEEEESEQKLKRTVHVLSMQRSKSDLDTSRETLLGGQGFNLMKSPMVYNQLDNLNEVGHRDSGTFGGKQEMKVGVAVIPRKGLISLSTTESQEDQTDNLKIGDNRRQSMMGPGEKTSVKRQKTLIKRQDILEHIQEGVKRLEIEEQQQQEQVEMAKSLGDYTIMDLQSKICEMTDAKSVRRPSPELDIASSDLPKKKPTISKQEKITLPAIKNINPFTMKT